MDLSGLVNFTATEEIVLAHQNVPIHYNNYA